MKTKYRYILAFILIALLAVILMWKYTFRESETSVSDQKPEIELEASVLVEAFETDETKANQVYLGKIIQVSGTVNSIANDSINISVYLKENVATAGVICSFDKDNADVTRLKTGISIQIKGICTGYLMDVIMNRCSLVEVTKD